MNTHKQKAAGFLALGFSAILLVISALTSFGFFAEFFPTLLPPDFVAPEIGRLVSGAAGVLLLDAAAVVWLMLYLHDSETAERRAIALSMAVATFIGAAAASVAYLGLTAGGEVALDGATRATVADLALVAVIAAIVANFGASLAYNRFSAANKEAVRESDMADVIAAAEAKQAVLLAQLVSRNVEELLNQQAADLAARQAQRIAGRFLRHESARYQLPAKNQNGREPVGSFNQDGEPGPFATRQPSSS